VVAGALLSVEEVELSFPLSLELQATAKTIVPDKKANKMFFRFIKLDFKLKLSL
jgi:hypothetical protein